MAPNNGGQPKKILILAGAGASAHAEYPCAPEVSEAVWARVQRVPGFESEAFTGLAGDFELLHDALVEASRAAGPPEGSPKGAALKAALDELRSAVTDSFRDPPKDHPNAPDWRVLWPHFLRELVRLGHRPAIFTTNYDALFEDVVDCLRDDSDRGVKGECDLDTGRVATKGGVEISVARILRLAADFGDGCTIPVVYLHGCVAWAWADRAHEKIRLVVDPESGRAVPSPTAASVLWPGRGKLPEEAVFVEAYQTLARAAAQADIIAVVGYRMRDPGVWAAACLPPGCTPPPRSRIAVLDTARTSDDLRARLAPCLPAHLRYDLYAWPHGFSPEYAFALAWYINEALTTSVYRMPEYDWCPSARSLMARVRRSSATGEAVLGFLVRAPGWARDVIGYDARTASPSSPSPGTAYSVIREPLTGYTLTCCLSVWKGPAGPVVGAGRTDSPPCAVIAWMTEEGSVVARLVKLSEGVPLRELPAIAEALLPPGSHRVIVSVSTTRLGSTRFIVADGDQHLIAHWDTDLDTSGQAGIIGAIETPTTDFTRFQVGPPLGDETE